MSSGRGSAPDLPAGSSSPISGVDDTSAKASRETRWSGGWTQQALSWRPTVLEVVVRRYRCSGCGHVWHQHTSAANSRSRSIPSRQHLQLLRHRHRARTTASLGAGARVRTGVRVAGRLLTVTVRITRVLRLVWNEFHREHPQAMTRVRTVREVREPNSGPIT